MTTSKFFVVFDAVSYNVTPYGSTELCSDYDRYEAYREFYVWMDTHFVVSDHYHQILARYFCGQIVEAYNNYEDNFRGLPTHDQYNELVSTFNKALTTGSVMLRQQLAQTPVVVQPPAPKSVPRPQPAAQPQGIFDGVVYKDRKAERIAKEKEDARQQAERERVHDECLKTVTKWMEELPAAFKRAGKEPLHPSKLFSKVPLRAFTWDSGWLINNGVYVTTNGSFYVFKEPSSRWGPSSDPVSRKSVSARQAAEIAFDAIRYPFIRAADGTILADVYEYEDGHNYTRDVKQFLINRVSS